MVRVCVLAAGEGTRLGGGFAKPLTKICGVTFIEIVMRLARHFDEKPLLVASPKRPEVADAAGDCQVVWQQNPGGTGEAVLLALNAAPDATQLLTLCADAVLLRKQTLQALVEHHKETEPDATLLLMRPPGKHRYGVIRRDGRGRIVGIEEGGGIGGEVFAGVAVWDCDFLRRTLPNVRPDAKKGEVYLTAVVDGNGRFEGVECAYEEGLGVNDAGDLAAATAIMRRRIVAQHLKNGVLIPAPDLVYIEDGVEIAPQALIEPFCVIRRGVKIGAGCVVGPFSHLRAGTVLEDGAEVGNFVECKKTRLGRRAKAKHLSYLGDGDVGEGANIGAGTIFANWDGREKHRTVVGKGAFVGSGSVLVAPCKVGDGATTGAGAVVTRGKEVPAGGVWVGVPAKPLKNSREENRGSG